MPRDAPQIKIDNTRALGAQTVLYDRDIESREGIAAWLKRIADEPDHVTLDWLPSSS